MSGDTKVLLVGVESVAGLDAEAVGWRAELTETAESALAALADVDVVIAGCAIPNRDVADFCATVRSTREEVPLFVYAASGSESLAGTVVAAGADGYVPASDGFETLVDRVNERVTRNEHATDIATASTILEAVGDGIYVLDERGRFVAVNDTLEELSGYDRTDLIGMDVGETIGEEDYELAEREVRNLAFHDPDDIATYEIDLHTADGDRIPCEVSTTVVVRDGEFAGSVGIVRDIRDRRFIEAELVDRRRKIETLHDVAARLEACDTPGEVYEVVVDAAEEVLNFDVCVADSVQGELLVTEAVSSNMHEDGYENVSPKDEGLAGRSLTDQETILLGDVDEHEDAMPERSEYRSGISAPIGQWGVFQAVSTEYDAFDEYDVELVELLLSHAVDALDGLQYEQQLREERDHFLALFENVPDAVVITRQSETGPIVEEVNPAFERIFGYEAEEIVGANLDEHIVPLEHEREAESINRRGSRGEIVETEVKRRAVDGMRDFMLRVVPMEMDSESRRGFGLYTDVTEQKQRQKRVEILNRVLRHDLRNGMNIINGSAEMLEEVVDETYVQFAEAIQERAGELISLAEKTRAVERTLERGDVATGPVDIVDAVDLAVERVEDSYDDVSVTVDVPDRAYARADDLLVDAIYHVVENAAEHNDGSGATIEIALELEGPEDGMLELRVADDGPGLPDAERELLQEDKEITQLRHASGLGLWLVDWVVEQSGGLLRFEDNEPRGTIVTVQMPRADPASTGHVSDGAAAGN